MNTWGKRSGLGSAVLLAAIVGCNPAVEDERPPPQRTSRAVTSANGLAINGLGSKGVALNGERAAVNTLLKYLASCALPPGNPAAPTEDACITVDDDGTPFVYCGEDRLDDDWVALDPSWRNDVPTLSQAGVMAECVIARANDDGNPVTYDPSIIRESLKVVLRYMIECALPTGVSVPITDDVGVTTIYDGALGLAPEWYDGQLPAQGQKRVSACLAARTNATGTTVQISLRGIAPLSTRSVEKLQFRQHEGGFAANLFAAQPYVKSCFADNVEGISGRTCAEPEESNCGFTDLGDGSCASACTQNSDGTFTNCDGETEVLNTFLPNDFRVSFGTGHTCLKGFDGTMSCWGSNNFGQLGNESTSSLELVPQPVAALGSDVASAVDGREHDCARLSDGSVSCWGRNSYGQLGDGTTLDNLTPTTIAALGTDVAQVTGGETMCAVTTQGQLYCWGRNDSGQVGIGIATTVATSPTPAGSFANVAKADSSGRHSCGLQSDGNLSCWGRNNYGQLGIDSTTNARSPQFVMSDVADMCTGENHSCAVRGADGTVWCWGRNRDGQLGDRSKKNRDVPVQADPIAGDVVAVACGRSHTCALADGDVWCWGSNIFGLVGDGTTTNRNRPVRAAGIASATELSVGDDFACATREDGTVWCWGRNTEGELGDGSTANRFAPIPMSQTYSACGDGDCESALGEDEHLCAADCGGATTCSTDVDCNGACGGSAVVDACGECGGDGSSCGGSVSIQGVAGQSCDQTCITAGLSCDVVASNANTWPGCPVGKEVWRASRNKCGDYDLACHSTRSGWQLNCACTPF